MARDTILNIILNLKKQGTGARDAKREFKELDGAIRAAGAAMVGFGAAGTALMGKSVMVAARAEQLGVALEVIGKNAGYSKQELQEYEEATAGMGITTSKTRESMMMMAQAQIDLAHSADLARVAQDTAILTQRDSSDTFRDLIQVIQTGNTRMARNMMLTVDWESAYEDFAASAGKATSELTEQEKIQARTMHVMEQATSVAGAYEASMDTAAKKMGSLNRQVETAQENLGRAFVPALGAAVDAASGLLEAFNDLEPAQQDVAAHFIGIGSAASVMGGSVLLALPHLQKTVTILKGIKGATALASIGLGTLGAVAAGTVGSIAALYAVSAKHIDQLGEAKRVWMEEEDAFRRRGRGATQEARDRYQAETELANVIERLGGVQALSEGQMNDYAEKAGESGETARQAAEGWTEYGGAVGILAAKTRTAGDAYAHLRGETESATPITDAYNEKAREAAQANREAATAAAEHAGEVATLSENLFEATEAEIASKLIGMLDPEEMGAEAFTTATTEIGTAFGIMDEKSIALAENLPKVATALEEGVVPAEDADEALGYLVDTAGDGVVNFDDLLEEFGNLPEETQPAIDKLLEMDPAMQPLPGLAEDTAGGIGGVGNAADTAAGQLERYNDALRDTPGWSNGGIPGLPEQSGTPFFPGGMAIVGEGGPELAVLPRGTEIHNATETKSIFNRTSDNRRGGVWTGNLIVQGAGDPHATAQAVIQELSDRGIMSGAALR